MDNILALLLAKKGGGGASSWNDLKDKPFYVESEGAKFYFDNDLTGRYVLPLSATMKLVKISDRVLTEEECVGAEIVLTEGDNTKSSVVQAGHIVDTTAQFGLSGFAVLVFLASGANAFGVVVVKESGIIAGFEVNAGTYYMSDTVDGVSVYTSYFSALDIPDKVKKLDKKFLPDLPIVVVSPKSFDDGIVMSHTSGEVMTAIIGGKLVFMQVEGTMLVVAGASDDGSAIIFASILNPSFTATLDSGGVLTINAE